MVAGLIGEEGGWQKDLSTCHVRVQSLGERLHRHLAQGEEGGGSVRGEVLADIEMDAEGVGEQRHGLVDLALHLIGALFLEEGIATLDDGRPREVIAIGKQIFMDVRASAVMIVKCGLTWI